MRNANSSRGQSVGLLGPDGPLGLDNIERAHADIRTIWFDFTPPAFRCEIAASCPAALHSTERKSFAIIGSTIEHKQVPELSKRVDSHETAVEVSEELLSGAVIQMVLQQFSFLNLTLLLSQIFGTLFIRLANSSAQSAGIIFSIILWPTAYLAHSIVALLSAIADAMGGVFLFFREARVFKPSELIIIGYSLVANVRAIPRLSVLQILRRG